MKKNFALVRTIHSKNLSRIEMDPSDHSEIHIQALDNSPKGIKDLWDDGDIRL